MNKIIDFSKGVNNKIDAEFIGGGFVAEAENVEYNHSSILSKRYGVETFDSELDTAIANLGITLSKFWIWYPSTMPTDAEGDYVVVVYGTNKLYVLKKQDDSWTPKQIEITNVNYTDSSLPVAFIGNKFLIADSVNKGHYIEVDKDGNLVYGILGIPAPINKISVSPYWNKNEYVSTNTEIIDTGMGIERGNILQLVYTVEDKYGNESNPSPVSTYTNLQYRYPAVTEYATFSYWWVKATYSNLAIPEGLDDITIDSLEKFNIYRRDVRYTEGGAESAIFRKVATIDIMDTHTDTSEYMSTEPSYEQDIAPVSKLISENSQVKFVANLKLKTVFPFDFRYYTEIKLTNENSRSYINAPIAIKLDNDDVFHDDAFNNWGDFRHDYWQDHIRIFDQDKTTPLPVVYIGDYIYYILLPYIPENSVRSIYVSYDEWVSTGTEWEDGYWKTPGVSDTWKSANYGQFISSMGDEWLQQRVFFPNRVRSADTLICCSNEYHPTNSVPNRADGVNNGAFTGNTEWVHRDYMPFLDLNGTIKFLPDGSGTTFDPTDGKNVIRFIDDSGKVNFGKVDADNNEGMTGYGWLMFDAINMTETPDIDDDTMVYHIYPLVSNLQLGGSYSDNKMYGWSLCLMNWDYEGSYKKGLALVWGDGDPANDHPESMDDKILFWDLDSHIDDYNNKWFIYFTIDPSSGDVLLTVRDIGGVIIEEQEPDFGAIDTTDYDSHVDMEVFYGSFDNFYHFYDETNWYTYVKVYALPNSKYSQFAYEKEVIPHDNHLQFMNLSPYFPEDFLGYTDGANAKIHFEDPTDNKVKDYKNFLKWSTVNGVNFPDLWERAFREPIKGIIPLRRKTELVVDNRMLIFGRNTLNIFTLNGEPDSWYDSTNNIIEDYNQFGILADNSLGSLNGRIFWISEVGAMMFDDVPIPISMNKIHIPIDEDMIGFAIPLRNQYAFHSQAIDPTQSITYVYHLTSDSWTTFTGLNLTLSRILSGGDATDNKNLFLDSSGLIKSYPSTSQTGFTTTVKTRKFPLDNDILRRFRTDFDGQMRASTEIQNRSTTLNQSFEPVDRMVFRGLSNGSFGEYIQFTLDGFTKLKKLEYEIQRR